ncbi:MAG: hypothetical protein A3I66_04825 [Burkholderiales bacterium RIFCSPLOWO2_02_FULL_57_36]|nr:MAG: hypothetical protein A3I66_04825 [Burkholderiales bacterium RIFCSPLOWO2_02_FULL_57_36]
MPPRPKYTRAQVQAAALAIADEHGVAALTMRSLASALGTGPMTIYNYVRNRDELDALVVEAVMSEAVWGNTGQGDWQQDVRTICEGMWLGIRTHPNVIPLILTRRSLHHATLAPAEAMLRALADSGRSGLELLMAFRTVFGFVIGLAQAQLAGPHPPSHEGETDPTIARVQALPPERFPKLVEIAHAASGVAPEDEFHTGLDIILAGLDAQTKQPAHEN